MNLEAKNLNSSRDILVMLPSEEWEELHEKLDAVMELIRNRNASENSDVLLDTSEVCKLLHISYKTFQKYREKRLIPYYQFDKKKILVKRCDLDAFLNVHFIPSRA